MSIKITVNIAGLPCCLINMDVNKSVISISQHLKPYNLEIGFF